MATAYGTNFNSSGTPLNGLPYTGPFSSKAQRISETIPTTSLDAIADFFALTVVACGRKIACFLLSSSAAFDTGTALDMDLVVIPVGSDGTLGTPTILENAGTAYEAARTNQIIDCGGTVAPMSGSGYCLVGYYVNTPATTAAAGVVTGTLVIE